MGRFVGEDLRGAPRKITLFEGDANEVCLKRELHVLSKMHLQVVYNQLITGHYTETKLIHLGLNINIATNLQIQSRERYYVKSH